MGMSFTLAYRLLKENKKRTLAIVLATSLVAAMITAVWFTVWEGGRILREVSQQESGKYHVFLQGVSQKDLTYINNYRTVENTSFEREIGYAKTDKLKGLSKPYVFLRSVESEKIEESVYVLDEGNWPKYKDEIVLPVHLREQLNGSLNIGNTVTLDVGKRVNRQTGELLTQEDNINLREDRSDRDTILEDIKDSEEMTFTITGFMKRPSYSMESSSAPGYTAITTGFTEGPYTQGTGDVSVTYYNVGQMEKSTSEIVKYLGYPINLLEEMRLPENEHKSSFTTVKGNETLSIYFNEEVNDNFYQGYSGYSTFTKMGLFLTVILVVFSFSAIYCTFSVCMQAQLKEFSLLRSMGATLRQIKQIILCEGVLLGFFVALLGVIAGFTGVYVTLAFIGSYINDLLPGVVEVHFGVSLQTVFIGMVIAFVTMVASVYVHTVKLKEDTVLLLSLYNKQYKQYKTKFFFSRIYERIFGFEAGLAAKNMVRNRRVYLSTLSSLLVSTVLIFCLSFAMNRLGGMQSENRLLEYDLVTNITPQAIEELNFESSNLNPNSEAEDLKVRREPVQEEQENGQRLQYDLVHYFSYMEYYYNQLSISENINTVVGIYGSFVLGEAGDIEHPNAGEFITSEDNSDNTVEEYSQESQRQVRVHVISEELYEERRTPPREYNTDSYGLLAYNADDGHPVMDINKLNTVKVDVAGTTKSISVEGLFQNTEFRVGLNPHEINIFTTVNGLYHLMGDQINQFDPYQLQNKFYVETFRYTRALEDIEAIIGTVENGDMEMTDNVEWKNERFAQKVVLYTFSLGLVGLVFLISLTNLYNTMHVSLSGRKREFAVLKSVGLQNKSLKKILLYECVYYMVQTILLSLIILFILNKALGDRVVIFSDGIFPGVWLTLGMALLLFLILYIAMRYFARTLFQENFLIDLKQIH